MLPIKLGLEIQEALQDQKLTGPETTGIVTTVFNGVIAAIAVAFSAAIFSKALGSSSTSEDLQEELKTIRQQIGRLSEKIERYRTAVRGTREHKDKLMREYGLTILPPVVEMRSKYPKLYHTDKYLRSAEQELERLEVRMLNLQKRRKELMVKLGLREEELPRKIYPAMKKFIPPTEKR